VIHDGALLWSAVIVAIGMIVAAGEIGKKGKND